MGTTTNEVIELGDQVTTPHGIGKVSWVEVGGDEFQVLMYERDSMFGASTGRPPYVTVDRAHIAHWPPRIPADNTEAKS